MQKATAHALTIDKLSKQYGSQTAVDGVSLDVQRGSFLTLLGPSGSGKTTILMAIAGFVRPSAGAILLDQREITDLPPERRNFGMVFQGYALFPHLTVEDNVWFPLRVRGVSKQSAASRIQNALVLTRMEAFSKRLPNQLSGGQQQRVALARALVFEPDLLLLDEPLSALDKKLRAELQLELKSLHRSLGTTFIYVTHDQEEALSMSDDIAILKDGKIEQYGSPADLYEHPHSRFVADFLGKSNFIEGEILDRGEQEISIRCNDFVVHQRATPASKLESTLTLALRPEKIGLFRNEPSTDNRLKGRIENCSYLGSSMNFQVSTKPLGLISADVPAWNCEIEASCRDEIWLGWNADASVPVRDA